MRSGWRLTTPAVLFINVGLARGNTKAAGTISACLLHQNHHRQMHLHAHPRMYSSGLCRGETKSACTSVATSQDNGSLCSSLWLCPPSLTRSVQYFVSPTTVAIRQEYRKPSVCPAMGEKVTACTVDIEAQDSRSNASSTRNKSSTKTQTRM